MKRTMVKDLPYAVGTQVKLCLTLDVLRDQKHMQFVIAHDASGSIQLVVSKATCDKHSEMSTLLQGSSFIVYGTVVATAQSKTAGMEVHVSDMTVMSRAQAWPITPESSIDLRFDHRVVDLKFEKSQLIFKVRSAFIQGCREYLLSQGLMEFQTPRLLKTASESGSQVFPVQYFERKAYLAQSPQFAKQAIVSAFDSGYFEVGCIFRAEKSLSSRHLTEFTGLDVEVPWYSLAEIMKLEEEMLCYAFERLAPFQEDVQRVFGVTLITKPSVHTMTLEQAKEILRTHGMPLGPEQDLPDEGERRLFEILGHDFIFVTDYPIAKRPFYHVWDRTQGTTKSYDLIMSGIEITSGSERACDYQTVCEQALEKGVTLESIEDYLQTFQYGTPPSAGFGIGVERVVAKLLGLASVKEASLFPKDPERL